MKLRPLFSSARPVRSRRARNSPAPLRKPLKSSPRSPTRKRPSSRPCLCSSCACCKSSNAATRTSLPLHKPLLMRMKPLPQCKRLSLGIFSPGLLVCCSNRAIDNRWTSETVLKPGVCPSVAREAFCISHGDRENGFPASRTPGKMRRGKQGPGGFKLLDGFPHAGGVPGDAFVGLRTTGPTTLPVGFRRGRRSFALTALFLCHGAYKGCCLGWFETSDGSD